MREGIFNVQLGNLCPGSLQPLMSGGSVTVCDGVQMWIFIFIMVIAHFILPQPSPARARLGWLMADTGLGGGQSAAELPQENNFQL